MVVKKRKSGCTETRRGKSCCRHAGGLGRLIHVNNKASVLLFRVAWGDTPIIHHHHERSAHPFTSHNVLLDSTHTHNTLLLLVLVVQKHLTSPRHINNQHFEKGGTTSQFGWPKCTGKKQRVNDNEGCLPVYANGFGVTVIVLVLFSDMSVLSVIVHVVHSC